MRKGVSPLIAAVLLIAFTLALAAILTAWISSFTAQQQEQSEVYEKQIECITKGIKMSNDLTSFDGSYFNTYITSIGSRDSVINRVQVELNSGLQIPKELNQSYSINKTQPLVLSFNLTALYPEVEITTTNLKRVRLIVAGCDDVSDSITRPSTGW